MWLCYRRFLKTILGDGNADVENEVVNTPTIQEENAEENNELLVSDQKNEATEIECENHESRYPKLWKTNQMMNMSLIMIQIFLLAISDNLEPTTVYEALSSARSNEWRKAIKNELDAFKANNAWKLIAKPSNKNTVKNKWVFKVKRDHNGEV